MAQVAAIVGWPGARAQGLNSLCAGIGDVAVVVPDKIPPPAGQHSILKTSHFWSQSVVAEALRWFQDGGARYLLWMLSDSPEFHPRGLQRLIDCLHDTRATMVYSDYFDRDGDGTISLHSLTDYQPGSLRDDFDFGQLVVLDGERLATVSDDLREEHAAQEFGGWYELRLRLSEAGSIVRLPEPTYTLPRIPSQSSGEAHFNYVDPRNRDYQLEMERIATAHLKRIDAYLDPPATPLVSAKHTFPVEATVVIPVKNRQRTVAEAVESALSQQTDFAFNVIVVDNHSTDGTSEILSNLARRDARLVRIVPQRTDLGIGGCWNEAIDSDQCGRFAIQLDSDDLYAGPDVVRRIVAEFHATGCAMVIGSYTLVDFDLNPIPPGLIDHREWTDENGHNNALRIAGLGAPCAFHTPTLRVIGFPNVSYGEDYAVALKISGRHRIGRIYDSLYWCRRWEDNTDHGLLLETVNRYAVYKDRIRSMEIAARQHRTP